MRIYSVIFCVLLNTATYCQPSIDPKRNTQVKQELETLWNNMQDAAMKKDRKALERIFADEFVFIHSSGQEDTKQRRIDNMLSIGDYSRAPLPSFDELFVYGDVAVLRAKGVSRGTTIFARKNGHWQVVQVQSTAVPLERKVIRLDPNIIQQYIGKYEQAPGVFTMITFENDTLRAKGATRPQVPILALSDTVFYVKDNVGEFTFYKDEQGKVTHYILRVNGREIKGTKVE